MPVPKHASGCHGRAYPSKCPKCFGKVYYFACSCGNKTFYQELGGEWPEHVCKVKKEKVWVPWVACERCGQNVKEADYSAHLETCVAPPVLEPVVEKTVAAIPSGAPKTKTSATTQCPYCMVEVRVRRMKVHLNRCAVYKRMQLGAGKANGAKKGDSEINTSTDSGDNVTKIPDGKPKRKVKASPKSKVAKPVETTDEATPAPVATKPKRKPKAKIVKKADTTEPTDPEINRGVD